MISIANGLLTLLLMILFIGIWVWAWSSHNKDSFEKMARLPLEDDNDLDGDHNVK